MCSKMILQIYSTIPFQWNICFSTTMNIDEVFGTEKMPSRINIKYIRLVDNVLITIQLNKL